MKRFSHMVSIAMLSLVCGWTSASAQTLSVGWSSADIGDIGQPGQVTESSGQFTVSGAGADIWDSTDAFQFVYRRLAGTTDIEMISVRLQSETAAESFAKAGIMIRQSLDPSSPHVILDVRPNGEVEFMVRDARGSATRFISGTTVSFPVTLMLKRQAGAVFASVLADCCGDAAQLGSIPFYRGPMLGGLAVNSHDRESLNTAVFDQASFMNGGEWNEREVGDVGLRGGSSAIFGQSESWTIDGAGDDIWGAADAFHFSYKQSTGDVDIVARVVDQSATQTFAKAALMMRVPAATSGEPGAGDAHVILAVRPDGNIEFMTRPTASGETFFLAGGTATYPGWLKLVRTGDRFEGFKSKDGASWVSIGATRMSAAARINTGMAVTSHDRTVLNRARFEQVVVTAGASQPTATTSKY